MSVTLDHSENLFSCDYFTLTCTIELDPAVDIAVFVSIEWMRLNVGLSDGNPSRIIKISNEIYQGTLTLNSLETSDSGNYTCTATVTPSDSFIFVNESEEASSVIIGECEFKW